MLRLAAVALVLTASLWAAIPDPLAGHWVANLGRSRFVPGFPALQRQTMDYEVRGTGIKCVAVRITAEGARTRTEFVSQYDGKEYPVIGSAEITGVILKRKGPKDVQGTFVKNHHAVFSYLMHPSEDGQTLTITSIDPETLRNLTSVVVYERK